MTGTASRPKPVRKPKVAVRKPAKDAIAKRSTKAVGFRGDRSGTVTKTAEKVSFASLRTSIDLTQAEFAKLFPISIRSLAGIESGTAPSESATRRFQELNRLIAALGEIMRTASIGTWLLTPNNAFDGLKPIEVIDRGEIDRLWSMIFYLRSGSPS